MRLIIALNGVLLTLAMILFAVDLWLDRSSLLGTGVELKTLAGLHLGDFLDGQPVIPDRIFISRDGHDIGLVYEPDHILWHKYPGIELVFINENIVDVWFL